MYFKVKIQVTTSIMDKNEFDRAVETLKKFLNKFADWGLTAGFIYTTEQGLLQFYQSEAMGDLINSNQVAITSHPAFSHCQSEEDPDYIPDDAGRMVIILLYYRSGRA